MIYLHLMHLFSLLTVMDAAITSFNKALVSPTSDYKVWYAQGDALAKKGRYEEALASFDQALAIQQNDPAAWVFRGVVLIQLGYYESAIASCEKALAIHSNDKQAWIVRGAALNYLGRYKQSYASYDEALEIKRQSGLQKLTQVLKGLFRLGRSSRTADTTTGTISSRT